MLQYPYPIRLTPMWGKTMRQFSERFSSCRTQQEYSFLTERLMRSSRMPYRVFASVDSQLEQEVIALFASKDEVFLTFFRFQHIKTADNRFEVVRRRMYCFRHSINGKLSITLCLSVTFLSPPIRHKFC